MPELVQPGSVMFSVPLLFQVRLAPSVPPVTVAVEPSGVVSVEATVASMVPADQFSVLVMVIAPAPVSRPPVKPVVPLNVEGPPRLTVPPLMLVVPVKFELPATVNAPPLILLVAPLNLEKPKVRAPAEEIVKLASQISWLAFCPGVPTVTVPAA